MSNALSSRILRVAAMTSSYTTHFRKAPDSARLQPRTVRLHRSILSSLPGVPRTDDPRSTASYGAFLSNVLRRRQSILYSLVPVTSISARESHHGKGAAHV